MVLDARYVMPQDGKPGKGDGRKPSHLLQSLNNNHLLPRRHLHHLLFQLGDWSPSPRIGQADSVSANWMGNQITRLIQSPTKLTKMESSRRPSHVIGADNPKRNSGGVARQCVNPAFMNYFETTSLQSAHSAPETTSLSKACLLSRKVAPLVSNATHTTTKIGKLIVLSNLNVVSVCPNGADILWRSAPLELENKIVQKKGLLHLFSAYQYMSVYICTSVYLFICICSNK